MSTPMHEAEAWALYGEDALAAAMIAAINGRDGPDHVAAALAAMDADDLSSVGYWAAKGWREEMVGAIVERIVTDYLRRLPQVQQKAEALVREWAARDAEQTA
jgi:hypothetical protein